MPAIERAFSRQAEFSSTLPILSILSAGAARPGLRREGREAV